MVDKRPLATPPEVAEHCRVTERTLESWRRQKKGPSWVYAGKHVRYRWADIEEWLDRQTNAVA